MRKAEYASKKKTKTTGRIAFFITPQSRELFQGMTLVYDEWASGGLLGGINPYAYALNNPLSYVDPLGLSASGTVGGVVGSWGGRAVGGAVGSFGGPVGTFLGGAAGGAIGNRFGTAVGDAIDNLCKDDKPCPPCKTISGKIVPVGTVGYRPLDVIPDNVKQHGTYGSHHNIFIAKQYPYPKCDCFWAKQSWVAKPNEIQPSWIPIEPFLN